MMLQTSIIGEGMWALILGPMGLLVASVAVAVILWRKLNAERKERAEEIASLHQARHEDLVSGMRYREEISGKLLEDKIEERVTANKLIDAVQSLSTQQEKTHETVQTAKQNIRDLKTIIESKESS